MDRQDGPRALVLQAKMVRFPAVILPDQVLIAMNTERRVERLGLGSYTQTFPILCPMPLFAPRKT